MESILQPLSAPQSERFHLSNNRILQEVKHSYFREATDSLNPNINRVI
jgi:predicted HD phosphohydrolase